MIRGTTALFKFKLPYAKQDIVWTTIRFSQTDNKNQRISIAKNLKHCDSPEDSNILCVSLTALETMRFSDKVKAKVQLRGQAKDGTIFSLKPKLITVYPIDEDLLTDDIIVPEEENGWIIIDSGSISATGENDLLSLDGDTITT